MDLIPAYEISYLISPEIKERFMFFSVGIAALIIIILRPESRRLTVLIGILVWNLLCTVSFIDGIVGIHFYRNILDSGKAEIVEGKVELLHSRPGGRGDWIRINGKELNYSNYDGKITYNQTIERGGVLRHGVYARLHVYKDEILKIELQ